MATFSLLSNLTNFTLIFVILILVKNNHVLSDSIVAASNSTGIPVADGNFSLSELDQFGHVDGVWGKVVINHEVSQYADPMTILKGIKGFVSSLVWIYKTYKSLTEEPQATINDVMKKMDSEFKDVKGQLTYISTELQKLKIFTYHNVDLVVDSSVSDIIHKTKTDLANRAINLYNQLVTFMNGMLGANKLSPDLMEPIRNLYDCGSKSIMKNVESFITLVNVGAVGISYYSTAINNEDIFNGESRIESLNVLKDAVLKRTNDVMNLCADMSKRAIEKDINKILGPRQADSDTTAEVSRLLYQRFDDVYPSHINWIFYAVWNFHPREEVWPEDAYSTEYMSYAGSGPGGVTKNGGWTVYWVGHPSGNTAGSTISVDSAKIGAIIHEMKYQLGGNRRNAAHIAWNLRSHMISGRAPVLVLVIGNPKLSATVGEPLSQLNVYYHRFHSDLKYVAPVIPIPYWRTNYFDVVIL